MIFICPMPSKWNEIYEKLLIYWNKNGVHGNKPPVPLILNGWVFTNDAEKELRWQETLMWADRNGCRTLIPILLPDEAYCVSEKTTYDIGTCGGPMYRPWDFEAKKKPLDEEVQIALNRLKQEWRNITSAPWGDELEPLGFSGKKRRKLVVIVKSGCKAPWGSWDSLDKGPKRRILTEFRKKINLCIWSLEVDHIEFIRISE